jgi:hypothetical protein
MSETQNPVLRQKLLAFSIHLGLSLSIFAAFFLAAAYLWYPDFYFSANNVWPPISTIAFVDVGLGPILTFVLYRRGKPGLKFDLSMIATLQILALLWGVWMLYSQRPVLTVYHDGLFFCLSQSQAEAAGADMAALSAQNRRIPLAYLPPAASPAEQQARDARLRVLPSGALAVPAYVFGEDFAPFGQPGQWAEIVRAELDMLPVIRADPLAEKRWQAFLERYPAAEHYAYFGLACSTEEHVLAFERDSGEPVDALAVSHVRAMRKHR